MGLHRLTSITLGVPDVDATSAFLVEFGLEAEAADGRDGRWHATRDGGPQLQLASAPQRALRRLGVGARHGDDLSRLADRARRLAPDSVVGIAPDLVALREPVTGLVVEATVAEPYPQPAGDSRLDRAVNRPGSVQRRDTPAASVLAGAGAPVRPSNLTHVVVASPDQPATVRYFTDVLGFEISDEVPGVIAFTRCGEVHHNVGVIPGPVAYPHHIAFEVDAVDDVVRGGQRMVETDPQRHCWGIGRHAIGSNWFWYLRDPSGVFVEYAADVDRISAQDRYRPKEWSGHEVLYSFGPPAPAEFIEPTDMADLIAASQ